MAVSMSVRNTFFHFEDSQCTGSEEQPSVLRAVTQPVYLCREHRSGQLEVTDTSHSSSASATAVDAARLGDESLGADAVDQIHGIVKPCDGSAQAPILLGRLSSHSAREPVGHGSSKESSKSELVTSHGGESLAQPSQAEWTTLMIRNLPSQYTRGDFVSLLIAQGFAGRFDFVYFPIDFETHAAMGYAFVNLVSPEDANRLWERLDGFSTWSRPCKKICRISWSQPLQGLRTHVARYRNSPLMHELVPDSYRPLLFAEGERVSFPPPTKKIKAPRKGNQRMLVPQA